MMKNKKVGVLTVLILYSISIVISALSDNIYSLHWGKDGGLFFRVITTSVVFGFFFSFMRKRISTFFLGLLIGIFNYFLTYQFYVLASYIQYGDNRGLNISAYYDQLICVSLTWVMCYLYYKCRANS